MKTYLSAREIDRYLGSYVRSNDFVADCIAAVDLEAWPLIIEAIVLQYGAQVVSDAAEATDWMIGSPWKKSGANGLESDVLPDGFGIDGAEA